MIILLNSNNTERLAVQSEATIQSGEGRTYFSMTIVDDELLNLSSEIQIHASATFYIRYVYSSGLRSSNI